MIKARKRQVTGKKKFRSFTDSTMSAIADFKDDPVPESSVPLIRGIFWDSQVRGLQLRVGVRLLSWYYFKQHRSHGTRSATCRRLGHWPAVSVEAARTAARVIAGSVASGHREPGARSALKFEAAFTSYLEHLARKAAKAGKPARWHRNVLALGKQLLLPKWGKWPLAEMSANPALVASWHRDMTKATGSVHANHAARLVRAVYRRAARLDRTLPLHNPASAVEYNSEGVHGSGLAFAEFPAWHAALMLLENPVHRAFHLVNLLGGFRPGELSRVRWSDIKPRDRVLIITNAKAGNEIRSPLSIPIIRALKIARAHRVGDLVFPGCAQRGRHDHLPARGIKLRRTYRTVAADCGVDEMLSHFLLGHAPAGISQRYVARMILSSGPALRSAQAKISARIVGLLGH